MSQNDFVIANDTAANVRQDMNDALQALASLSSGPNAPSITYANMLWYDTGNNTLKMRTEADDAWIDVGYLCQSTNKFCIFDDTNVVNSSGTQVGLIGDQPTSDWEAGTSTTESLVSPKKIRDSIPPALNATGSAPIYACRAWVNFDGTGTVSIRESGNVSSVTDNGTGDYTVNFDTALVDANYACGVNGGEDGDRTSRTPLVENKTTSSFDVNTTIIASGARTDVSVCDVIVTR